MIVESYLLGFLMSTNAFFTVVSIDPRFKTRDEWTDKKLKWLGSLVEDALRLSEDGKVLTAKSKLIERMPSNIVTFADPSRMGQWSKLLCIPLPPILIGGNNSTPN